MFSFDEFKDDDEDVDADDENDESKSPLKSTRLLLLFNDFSLTNDVLRKKSLLFVVVFNFII